jgi:hypothetical protein
VTFADENEEHTRLIRILMLITGIEAKRSSRLERTVLGRKFGNKKGV